jgi:hypothetical protein
MLWGGRVGPLGWFERPAWNLRAIGGSNLFAHNVFWRDYIVRGINRENPIVIRGRSFQWDIMSQMSLTENLHCSFRASLLEKNELLNAWFWKLLGKFDPRESQWSNFQSIRNIALFVTTDNKRIDISCQRFDSATQIICRNFGTQNQITCHCCLLWSHHMPLFVIKLRSHVMIGTIDQELTARGHSGVHRETGSVRVITGTEVEVRVIVNLSRINRKVGPIRCVGKNEIRNQHKRQDKIR